MIKRSLAGLAVAVSGLALSLTAGAGVASADPDIEPLINSTCSYGQVMAALNAQNPAAAATLALYPPAQQWLQQFVAAPPPQRREMAAQAQAIPQLRPYYGTIAQVGATCNNY